MTGMERREGPTSCRHGISEENASRLAIRR